jgi:type I restriction enzyme M protein
LSFLRYANNDKGLGIVLTPPHITELFADLAQVNDRSVVWDSCCGTGGFLISAMKRMVAASQGDSETVKRVKTTQLFGTEVQDDIYALAISNMILQGDGKSGIVLGSCFDDAERVRRHKPNVALLNPPYKASAQDIEELEFVIWSADNLEPGGTCIAIIPISCVLASEGPNLELKKRLMSKHTVEAVMSMPEELFFNSDVGAITCTIVLKAHQPHPRDKKTWLGYWRDDGFVKVKGKGRIDAYHRWATIKQAWLGRYLSRDTDGKHAVSAILAVEGKWCAEAYMTTDYSSLTEKAFQDELRKYLAYRVSEGV